MKSTVMTEEARALVTILIREVQDCLNDKIVNDSDRMNQIREILNGWVTANDLHPELAERLKIKGNVLYRLRRARWQVPEHATGGQEGMTERGRIVLGTMPVDVRLERDQIESVPYVAFYDLIVNGIKLEKIFIEATDSRVTLVDGNARLFGVEKTLWKREEAGSSNNTPSEAKAP